MASILSRVPSPLARRGRRPDPNRDEPPAPTPINEDTFVEMTLQEHLEELRSRILKCALAILGAMVIGLIFSQRILDKIAEQAKVPNGEMQLISPTEGFVIYFKVALYIGIAIAMPILIYQLLAFVSPGLTGRERRYVYISVPFITLMFAAGVAFAFFVLAPRALDFLEGFASNIFEWNPRAEELISFYLTLMIGMGLIFELPIVMYTLTLIGVMNAKRYGKFRKYALILCMIAAAIVTPTPDPFNMMLVAIPTYALYETGILLSRTVRRASRA
jgi:sec-independent protein translocase protein TatC